MINIEILHGSAFVSYDDKQRAKAAANAVFEAAGVTANDACKAFFNWWNTTDNQDYDAAPAECQPWIKAGQAASIALTEGWHNPNAACCYIYV